MKYLNGFMVAVFIGLLILMKHYDVMFQTYGVAHSLDMVFGYTAADVWLDYCTRGSLHYKIDNKYT